MFGLDVFILLVSFIFFKEFQAISFDAEFAELRGVPVKWLEIVLYCLVALSVIVLIRVVGVILVIALLTIPAVVSKQFLTKMKPIMLSSTLIAIVFTILGLLLSYQFNLPAGATIVLLLGGIFFSSGAIKKVFA